MAETELSQAGYARRIRVTPSYISQLIKGRKLTRLPNGKLNVKQADAQMRAFRDRSRDGYRKATIPTGGSDTETKALREDYHQFQQARTLKAVFDAKLRKLEFEQQSGSVVDAAEFASAAFSLARVARDNVLNLPKQIAAKLAGMRKRKDIEEFLQAKLTAALDSLSDEELEQAFEIEQ